MNRNWMLVILAGIIEVSWATGLKHSSSSIEWFITISLLVLSFYVLIQATKNVPVATAYAVFTGIGTAGTTLVEMIFFGEAFSLMKIGFILLLLAGVIGLKLVTKETDTKEGVV